jgi:hypothetical protein
MQHSLCGCVTSGGTSITKSRNHLTTQPPQIFKQTRAAALPDPLENKQQKEAEPELRVRDRGAQQLVSLLLTHLPNDIRPAIFRSDQGAKFLQQTIKLV